ncbi:MAG: hypothetical protein ABIJ26_04990 [Candidatus Margulisiibacteriota bacterium]
MSKHIIACFLILFALTGTAFASWDIGARPIGMGGAFVAQANDANAVFFNPAGIAFIDNWQVSGTTGGFMEDASLGMLSWAIPTQYGSVGIAFTDKSIPTNIQPEIHLGVNSPEPVNIAANTFMISYAYELNDSIRVKDNMGRLAFGVNIKSITNADYNSKLLYENQRLAETSADFGVLYKISPLLSVGVVAQDIINSSSAVSPGWNAGVSLNINDAISLNQDLNATGIEILLGDFALRAGLAEGIPSFGAGVKLGDISFDYAFKDAGVNTQSSHFFSLSYAPIL